MSTELERHHEAHPQSPTTHFAKLKQAVREHVEKSAAERAARDREVHDRTEYHRAKLKTEKGS
jgi:hypothetical protein